MVFDLELSFSSAMGMHGTEVALIPFFTLILLFLPEISLLVPSFGFVFIPIIKVAFCYPLLLFSIYEDLAVIYLFFFQWWGVQSSTVSEGSISLYLVG